MSVATAGPSNADAQRVAAQSAFVELSPLQYVLPEGAQPRELTAPAARLFYRFAPGENASGSRRACVVFSGGPGASSQSLWAQLGPDTEQPLTQHCDMLLIDARSTGLSYQLVDAPLEHSASFTEHNAYIDAADFLRAVVALQPTLLPDTQELVLVGESYGGVRATLMLELTRGDSARFVSPTLQSELAQLGRRLQLPPTQLFASQVLIQPTLAGHLQDQWVGTLMLAEESPLRRLATDMGRELPPCDACDGFDWMLGSLRELGRSPYDYRVSAAWLDDFFEAAQHQVFASGGLLTALTRERPPDGLLAVDRANAFVVTEPDRLPADPGEWVERLGALSPHDRYFSAFNGEVYDHSVSDPAREHGVEAFASEHGAVFIDNLEYVRTFITRARYDLLNYSPAIPLALAELTDVDIELDEVRGLWKVTYDNGMQRRIVTPEYGASHAVGLDAPGQLVADIGSFLND